MAHAYLVTGDLEEGITHAHSFVLEELGLQSHNNPNLITLRHGLFSVEDARKVRSLADFATTEGEYKAIVISAARIFHEAQNALLKLFEEPPSGTMLFLVIPSEGMLLETLRSRLMPMARSKANGLSGTREASTKNSQALDFLNSKEAEREKIIVKLLDRAKSDNDELKQAARLEAITFVEGLLAFGYKQWLMQNKQSQSADSKISERTEWKAFLEDLEAFLPILHERSAPLKLIFEHILLVTPTGTF